MNRRVYFAAVLVNPPFPLHSISVEADDCWLSDKVRQRALKQLRCSSKQPWRLT